jgi:excisionase family DNA binding protein
VGGVAVVHSGPATIPDDAPEPAATMRHDPEIPRLVGVARAADILGLGRQRVWQLIDQGVIPAVKPARDLLMREQAVLEYKAMIDAGRRPE